MRITESEYLARPRDCRGVWESERPDIPNWSEIREQYMGKRTLLVNAPGGGSMLLIEGLGLEIVPDDQERDYRVTWQIDVTASTSEEAARLAREAQCRPDTTATMDISREEMAAWADRHETSLPLAVAIHAIADENRSAEAIWGDPTEDEAQRVSDAIREHVRAGDFDPALVYWWGDEELDMRDVFQVELTEAGRQYVTSMVELQLLVSAEKIVAPVLHEGQHFIITEKAAR